MFLSLLVPLDRSAFAEQALPLALSIARRANACLDLVQVHVLYTLEERATDLVSFEPNRDAEGKQREQLYLDATAKWLAAMAPLPISGSVLSGSAVLAETVADGILERVRAGKADLIVMATHGHGALSRFGLGSVANELIRRTPVPILLVRPSEEAPEMIPEPVLENILIPLDGSVLAEQALAPALSLARLMEARCTLLRVVDSRVLAADQTPGALPNRAKTEAEGYLERVAARIRASDLQIQTRVAIDRDATAGILDEAHRQGSDLIALATHGRSGLKRLLLGSVAEKVVREASSPVLVCPPAGK